MKTNHPLSGKMNMAHIAHFIQSGQFSFNFRYKGSKTSVSRKFSIETLLVNPKSHRKHCIGMTSY